MIRKKSGVGKKLKLDLSDGLIMKKVLPGSNVEVTMLFDEPRQPQRKEDLFSIVFHGHQPHVEFIADRLENLIGNRLMLLINGFWQELVDSQLDNGLVVVRIKYERWVRNPITVFNWDLRTALAEKCDLAISDRVVILGSLGPLYVKLEMGPPLGLRKRGNDSVPEPFS